MSSSVGPLTQLKVGVLKIILRVLDKRKAIFGIGHVVFDFRQVHGGFPTKDQLGAEARGLLDNIFAEESSRNSHRNLEIIPVRVRLTVTVPTQEECRGIGTCQVASVVTETGHLLNGD
jgi:hypothetical protein